MKRDRFLIGILVGIGVLVIITLVIFFNRQASQDYVAETTPEGVVHNFFYAYMSGDYERAYGYLADGEDKPSQSEFISRLSREGERYSGAGVQISDSHIIEIEEGGREAVVELVVIYSGSGPFDTGYRNYESANLVEQDGEWKIVEMPYWYWWDWYPDVYPER